MIEDLFDLSIQQNSVSEHSFYKESALALCKKMGSLMFLVFHCNVVLSMLGRRYTLWLTFATPEIQLRVLRMCRLVQYLPTFGQLSLAARSACKIIASAFLRSQWKYAYTRSLIDAASRFSFGT